ncbi:hypothetical protein D3C81_983210 [compost metagenome]
MHQHAVIAFAQIDHVRANAANRANLGIIRLTVKDRYQPRDSAFGQHLIDDVCIDQARLRAGRRRIVNHDGERSASERLLERQPRQRGGISGSRRFGRRGLLRDRRLRRSDAVRRRDRFPALPAGGEQNDEQRYKQQPT